MRSGSNIRSERGPRAGRRAGRSRAARRQPGRAPTPVASWPSPDPYWSRRAVIGSTLDARHAGIHVATSAMPASAPTRRQNCQDHWATPDEQAADRGRHEQRRAQSNGDAGSGEQASLSEHRADDLARARAKRHAQADLARALRHRVEDDTVDADGGDEERDDAERRRRTCPTARTSSSSASGLFHRLDVEQRKRRIDARARRRGLPEMTETGLVCVRTMMP